MNIALCPLAVAEYRPSVWAMQEDQISDVLLFSLARSHTYRSVSKSSAVRYKSVSNNNDTTLENLFLRQISTL